MSELGAAAAAVESAAVADMVAAETRAEEAAAHVEIRKDEIAAGVEMNRQNNETAERIAEIEAEAHKDEDEDEDRWQSCENRLASLETTLAEMSGQLTALQSLIPPPPPPEPEPEAIPVETPLLPLSVPEKSEATKEKPKPGGLLGWLIW